MPWWVLASALVLTFSCWTLAGRLVHARDANRFETAAEDTDETLLQALDLQFDTVRNAADDLGLVKAPSLKSFRAVLSEHQWGNPSLPIAYIPAGKPDTTVAVSTKIVVEPPGSFDLAKLSSESLGRIQNAIREAASAGGPTASRAISFSDAPKGQDPGFCIVAPVFTTSATGHVAIGFVLRPVRSSNLFSEIGLTSRQCAFQIYDIQAKDTAVLRSSSVYDSRTQTGSAQAQELKSVQPLDLPGTSWTAVYTPTSEFFGGAAEAPFVPWILIAGIALSLVLFFMSSGQTRAKALAESLAVDNSRLLASAQQEVSERTRAEEQIRQLNEDLEKLVGERTRELRAVIDELEAFCYSVSHDLRAPLRSVDGFSKALLEDYHEKLDQDGVDYIRRVRSASKRMDELITALLTLSRLTRTEIHPERLWVSSLAEEIAYEQDPDHKVDFDIQPDLSLSADPQMLRIVLENLISNAVKFSSKVDHPKVEIGRVNGSIFIRDNGAGFNPDFSGKLFLPFERLHNTQEFPGSGIGLATAARIVKRHGGRIWAESQEGEGATFFFEIPRGSAGEILGHHNS